MIPLEIKQISERKKRNGNTVFKINSPVFSLIIKEFKLYFSSLTYVSNTIITPVVIVILNISILIGIIPSIDSISYDLLGFTISSQQIYVLIVFTFVILTTTTSCSISFEGKSIWIMLVAPINIKKIAIGKILVNILLFLPGIVLTSIVFYTVFHAGIFYLIIISTLLVSTLTLISIIGFLVNLRFPSYNWSSEMEVVKQSKGTIVTAIISMIIIPIVIAFVLINNSLLTLLVIFIEMAVIIIMFKKITADSLILK